MRRAGLAAGAVLLGLAGAAHARAAAPSTPDARIAELEAMVRALSARVEQLEARGASAAPSPPAVTAPGEPLATAEAAPSPGASAPPVPQASVRTARSAPPPPTSGESPSPSTAASAPAPGAPATALARTEADIPAGVIPLGTPTSAASASIAGGKPTIQSADGQFSTSIHAVMQLDAADFFQATPGPIAVDQRRGGAASETAHARDLSSGTDFRRARLGIDGRLFGAFEYSVLTDFGGSGEEDAGHLQELWIQYSGLRPFHLRVGTFAPFIGLDDAGSSNGMPFLERSAVEDLTRALAAGSHREAVQLVANTPRWFGSLAVTGRSFGVVNATGTGVPQPYDSQLGLVGRVATSALRGKDWLVHLGAHGSWVDRPADAGGPDDPADTPRYPIAFRIQPEERVDATRLIDTGAIEAAHAYTAGVELAAQAGPVLLQAEYDRLGIVRRAGPLSDPQFFGFYVLGSWMITGERRVYNFGNYAFDGPLVRHPFNPRDGGWGAFELAARYSRADLNWRAGLPGQAAPADGVRGGDQTITTLGLNWYVNPAVRVMLDGQFVHVDRLSPSAKSFLTSPGAQVGQSYSVIDLRSQFAF